MAEGEQDDSFIEREQAGLVEEQPQYYRRRVIQIRCYNPACNKLFTKVIIHLDVSEADVINDEDKIKKLFTNLGVHVKVGVETWCRQCKSMDNKLIVVG